MLEMLLNNGMEGLRKITNYEYRRSQGQYLNPGLGNSGKKNSPCWNQS